MDELTKKVLERVAQGVWIKQSMCGVNTAQCAFCCVAPHASHEDWCEVTLARKVLDESL